MKTIAAGILSAGLLVALTGSALAENSKRKPRRHVDSLAAQFPSATPRQLKNARAYENGGYYETDSNAHPVGSRSWFAMKERESGGDRRQ